MWEHDGRWPPYPPAIIEVDRRYSQYMAGQTGRTGLASGSVITLLTDFGLRDAYVGMLRGVILGISPETTIVDVCHEVPAQDVQAGAFLLMISYPYFPAHAIHLAVVDPGVGTERKLVAARAGKYTFVGPDNGLLLWAIEHAGGVGAAVAIEDPRYRLQTPSRTFHGRDILAPAAAHLATGGPLEALGPRLHGLTGSRFPTPAPARDSAALTGEVIYIDRYGNCVTNLPPMAGSVEVAGQQLDRYRTYGEGLLGEPMTLTGSAGYLEIAVPRGSAAATLGLEVGTPVTLQVASS